MTLPDEINTYIMAGGAIATTIVGYLTGRGGIKRAATDTKGVELENVTKAITIWEDTATKLNAKIKELEVKHDECELTKDGLMCKVRDLEGNISVIRQETEACDRRFAALSAEMEHWKDYVGKHIGFPPKPNRTNDYTGN
jgi:chromosome segregation ATPase